MKKMFLILIGIILLMQLIQPEKTNPPVDTTITLKAPQEVMQILKRACYDCHSYETIWPWYSNIAPLSWSIASHVKDGREAVNFSKWEEIQDEIKIKRLDGAKDIPLPSYETEGSCGMDLRAAVQDRVTLKPGEIRLIPTGIAVAVPPVGSTPTAGRRGCETARSDPALLA